MNAEQIKRCAENGINIITVDEAHEIVDSREPIGLFMFQNDFGYVGIDNSDEEAWTEDFKKFDNCVSWLNGGYKEEDTRKMNDCVLMVSPDRKNYKLIIKGDRKAFVNGAMRDGWKVVAEIKTELKPREIEDIIKRDEIEKLQAFEEFLDGMYQSAGKLKERIWRL